MEFRLEDFYREKRSKDGRASRCVHCTRIAIRYYRLNNAERLRSYEKHRNRTAKRKKYFKELAKEEKRKEAQSKSKKKYLERNPLKARAHSMVRAAKLLGILKQNDCEKCGADQNINAHHDDYDKPLVVRWLCHRCHKRWHAENGPGANG